MTRVKICGLKTVEDIYMINRLKPDFVGFVFAGKKRRITPEQAAVMKGRLLPEIKSVGVFVNEDVNRAAALARQGTIDLIQLHGDEEEDYILQLKALTEKPVIKAVRVRSREDILRAQTFSCEYLLLDTYKKNEYGGSGEAFQWDLIPGEMEKPCFLAGGLGIYNIAAALRSCTPWAVDVSSSVEENGRKAEDKVRAFIEKVHELDAGTTVYK